MKAGQSRDFVEINITPLTDIFLVLLIIMMVVTPLINFAELQVNLSAGEANVDVTPGESKSIHLNLAASGEVTIESQGIVQSDMLVTRLRELAGGDPSKALVLHPDPNVLHDFFTQTLAAVMEAGITSVSIDDSGAVTTAPDVSEDKNAAPQTKSKS